ncbi:nidogen-2 [Biomphalaria pfeifferi]|uniref:Nidogen-2 n=1 Tax=Biomphalaria pfeifferi TaxID=112525 RepID=A0AAD8FLL2_BIOPF|nr:nidogen-2 [Biomphalaria pfeifferi]
MLFALIVSLAMVSTINAIVCTPDMCATVRCAAVTAENCDGAIVKNGGFCGCCDSCIKALNPGDRAPTNAIQSYFNLTDI